MFTYVHQSLKHAHNGQRKILKLMKEAIKTLVGKIYPRLRKKTFNYFLAI